MVLHVEVIWEQEENGPNALVAKGGGVNGGLCGNCNDALGDLRS